MKWTRREKKKMQVFTSSLIGLSSIRLICRPSLVCHLSVNFLLVCLVWLSICLLSNSCDTMGLIITKDHSTFEINRYSLVCLYWSTRYSSFITPIKQVYLNVVHVCVCVQEVADLSVVIVICLTICLCRPSFIKVLWHCGTNHCQIGTRVLF